MLEDSSLTPLLTEIGARHEVCCGAGNELDGLEFGGQIWAASLVELELTASPLETWRIKDGLTDGMSLFDLVYYIASSFPGLCDRKH